MCCMFYFNRYFSLYKTSNALAYRNLHSSNTTAASIQMSWIDLLSSVTFKRAFCNLQSVSYRGVMCF